MTEKVKDTLRRVAKLLLIVIVAIITALLSECYHGRAACVAAELVNGESITVISGEIMMIDPAVILEKTRKKDLKEAQQSDVDLLAQVIFYENWNTDPEHMAAYYTGAVVLKRVKSESWPDTIRDVLYQTNPKQYSTTDAFFTTQLPDECYDMARDLIETGAPDVPDNVVYQSMRPQGSGVWKKIKTDYFCFE